MMMSHPEKGVFWQVHNDGVEIFCHVQPGARTEGYAGIYGCALKIRIRAAAIDNKANQACKEFLARSFGVALRDVELVHGTHSRDKRWLIRNMGQWPEALRIWVTAPLNEG